MSATEQTNMRKFLWTDKEAMNISRARILLQILWVSLFKSKTILVWRGIAVFADYAPETYWRDIFGWETGINRDKRSIRGAIFINNLRGRDKWGKSLVLLGVQEAVGSNPAVPTFRINNLRAQMTRPFFFCYTLSYTFEIEIDFNNGNDEVE